MPFDGFRVGMLFALAGAAIGVGAYAGFEQTPVWVGGVFGAIGGIMVWRVLVWLAIGGAAVRAVVRWLFRDPYRRN